MDIIELKSELLCYGINPSNEAAYINPYFNEKGYIQGSTIILEDNLVVNIPVNEQFVKQFSPFYIKIDENRDKFILYKKGNPVALCNLFKLPSFNHNIGEKLFEYIRPHSNDTLFYAPIKECIHAKQGNKCLFCTYSGNNKGESVIKNLADIFDISRYKNIAIGGATPSLYDSGIGYYCRLIKNIKEINEVEISIEIVPPKEKILLDDLYNAGANSVIMNLEIYDNDLRKKICPGKSIGDIYEYVNYCRYALNLFGDNNVSSVLLVGLEDINNTLKAAEILIVEGIIPTLIPFKPYDDCALSFLPPTNSKEYFELSMKVGEMLREYGLGPSLQSGCTRCGGCSLERDISMKLGGNL